MEPISTTWVIMTMISGWLGGRTDTLLSTSTNLIYKRIINRVNEPVNHHIQRGVRKSYLQALHVAAVHLAKKQGTLSFTDRERKEQLMAIKFYVAKELQKVKSWDDSMRGSALDQEYRDVLFPKEVGSSDRKGELISNLISSIVEELTRNNLKVPDAYVQVLQEGWMNDQKEYRFYGLISAFFAQELKENTELSTMIQTEYLDHISTNIEGILIRIEDLKGQINPSYEFYQDVLPKLNQILEGQSVIREEISNIPEKTADRVLIGIQKELKQFSEDIQGVINAYTSGEKTFNELFTKRVMLSIKPHSIPAQKFLDRVKNIPDWEEQARISDKAKEIIAYSFVGVIGIQISKFLAIGKEPLSKTKQQKYLHKGISIIKRSMDLVNFAFLSALWDYQKSNKAQFDAGQKQVLEQFFDRSFEQSIAEQLELMEVMWEIFTSNTITVPFPQLDFASCQNRLISICMEVSQLKRQLDRQEYGLLECFAIEQQLAGFFDIFSFLVQYEMASIKRIGYKQMRHLAPRYLHRFTALGIDSKANVDAEKVMYTEDTVNTDAVLIYTGERYDRNVNLFPLIIDYNALTFEQGAKICFFQSKNVADGSLEFQFLEDNGMVNIEEPDLMTDEIDYNKLMLNKDGQVKLNLFQVVAAFREARQVILQDEVYLEDL